MQKKSYDSLYVEFIYYFNVDRDFFECHEVLEELWLEEGRSPLYQGLLQVAVGLHHYSYGNASGSIKLFSAGIEKLDSYPDQILGIDLKKVIGNAAEYVRKLREVEREPLDFYTFDIDIIDSELSQLVDELKLNPPQKHDEI
jgi:predicted metal-dependent hydrolase